MKTNQAGFTLIEVLTTVVVALIFLLSAFQLVGTIQQLSITGNQMNVADALAYSNMRMYANGESPSTWFDCPSDDTVKVLINKSDAVSGLPSPVLQHVEATAPYGCTGTAAGLPLRVESYVQYGPSNRKVTHATYVSY